MGKRVLWIVATTSSNELSLALAQARPQDTNYIIRENSSATPINGTRAWIELTCWNFSDLELGLRWKLRALKFDRFIIVGSPGQDTLSAESLVSLLSTNTSYSCLKYARAYLPKTRQFDQTARFWTIRREPVFNSAGYRGAVCPVTKRRDEFRVFCLGGSTTYGSGYLSSNREIESDESYPAYLENHLNQNSGSNNRPTRVINLGVTGISSGCLENRLKDYLHLKPDAVVIHSGYNDLPLITGIDNGEYIYMKPDLYRPECFQWLVERHTRSRSRAFRRLQRTQLPSGELLGDFFLGYDVSKDPSRHHGTENDIVREFERRQTVWLRNIKRLIGFCLRNDWWTLVVFQQPIIPGYWVSLLSSLREPRSADLLRRLHMSQQQTLRSTVGEFVLDKRLLIVDLQNAFRDARSLYIDEVHLSPEGNNVVAQYISNALVSAGALERIDSHGSPVTHPNSTLRALESVTSLLRPLCTRHILKNSKRNMTRGSTGHSPFFYPMY